MSWNVTANGKKKALIEKVEADFASYNQPLSDEYSGARSALLALLNSVPDADLYSLEAWGSVSSHFINGKQHVTAGAHIELKAVNRID